MLLAARVRHPFRNCPGFERASHFQPQIVMQAGRIVLLNDKAISGSGLLVSIWFGRLAEIPLSFVFLKGHRINRSGCGVQSVMSNLKRDFAANVGWTLESTRSYRL